MVPKVHVLPGKKMESVSFKWVNPLRTDTMDGAPSTSWCSRGVVFPTPELQEQRTGRSLCLPTFCTNDLMYVGAALFFFYGQIFVALFLTVFQRAYILFTILIADPCEGFDSAFQLATSLDRLY